MNLKKTIALLILISFLSVQSLYAEQKSETLAVINGEKITMDYFDTEFGVFLKTSMKQAEDMSEAELIQLKNKFLSDLVTSRILYQESQKLNLLASDEDVNSNLESFLKENPGENSMEEFKKTLGVDEEIIKRNIRKSLSIRNLLDKEIKEKAQVSDEEILMFYSQNGDYFKKPEMVKASHILVTVKEDASEDEKKKAKESILAIKAKLDAGESFEALAKENSECPSASKGGDLGFFEKGKMVKPFADAAFALEEGKISDVVETVFGYHLIMVTGKKKSSLIPMADIKDRLKQYLEQKKGKEMFEKYLEGLTSSSTIEVTPFKAAEKEKK